MENDCIGCVSFDGDTEDECEAEVICQISETYKCPCINCIIKGMCNSACEDFHDYMVRYKAKIGDMSIEGY